MVNAKGDVTCVEAQRKHLRMGKFGNRGSAFVLRGFKKITVQKQLAHSTCVMGILLVAKLL